MSRQKLQDRLIMKKVEPKHGEQFNALLRYVFQVTNHDLQTFGWENREIAQAKLPVLKEADVLGWFDGDKLISQLAVYPFQVNIFGDIYDMGGLTGVGTYPEYANLGAGQRGASLDRTPGYSRRVPPLRPGPSRRNAAKRSRMGRIFALGSGRSYRGGLL